jgi:hypothetical protein
MANKQISELTEADALDGEEILHLVQGGNSRQATIEQIMEWIKSGVVDVMIIADAATINSAQEGVAKLHISEDGTEVHTDLINNNDILTVSSDNLSGFLTYIVASATANHAAGIRAKRARGTLDAPEAVQSGDSVLFLRGSAWDGAAIQSTAQIAIEIDGTVSSGAVPKRIVFYTGPASSRIERMRLGSNGALAINTTETLGKVHVSASGDSVHTDLIGASDTIILSGEAATNFVNIVAADSNGTYPFIKGTKAKGALDAPTAVADGAILFGMRSHGWDGDSSVLSAEIQFIIEGAVSDGVMPTAWRVMTTETNSRTERMRVHPDGRVSIGATTPSALLNVNGTFKKGVTNVAGLSGFSASDAGAGAELWVTDAPGGACNYRSNGTSWVQEPTGIYYKTVSTNTYSMVDADFVGNVHIICTHASGCAITIPSGLVGTQPCIVEQGDPDSVTFTASGTTLNSLDGNLTIAGQYGQVTVQPRGSDVFHIAGALIA